MKHLLKVSAVLTLTLLLIIPTGIVIADNSSGQSPEKDVGRVRKKVEALRAWRLTEDLDLNEETTARLFPAIRETDEVRVEIEKDNRELLRNLRFLLKSENIDQGEIDRVLDQLLENNERKNSNEKRHLEKVRIILTPEKTARYIIFQFRFQQELKKLIQEKGQHRKGGS